MVGPPLLPGCMVVWFDTSDVSHMALCVQFEEHLETKVYVLTIVHDQRIKALTLFQAEQGKKWRVLHGG